MKRSAVVFTILICILFSTGYATPLVDTPQDSLKEKKNLAVNFVRLVNTAEMNYRHDEGRYGTFAYLVKSSELQKVSARFPQFASVLQGINSQSESEPIAGLQFGLVLAGDGTKYKLSVREKQDKPACGFAFFSDESGLIFEGRVIDCPAQ
jgi:hypothetical protein